MFIENKIKKGGDMLFNIFNGLLDIIFCIIYFGIVFLSAAFFMLGGSEKIRRYSKANKTEEFKHLNYTDIKDLLLILFKKSKEANRRFPRDLTQK